MLLGEKSMSHAAYCSSGYNGVLRVQLAHL